MEDYKLFIQRIGLVGIANIALALSSIIIIPVLTKNLTVEDYGVWVQFIATTNLLPFFTTLGLPYAMIRFLASSKKIEKTQEVFYSFFSIILLVSLIISLIIILFSSELSNLLFGGNGIVMILLPFSVFFASLIMFLSTFFRTFQQIKIYSFFLAFQAYLTIIFAAYFIEVDMGLFGALLGYVSSQILSLISMYLIIYTKIKFSLPKFEKVFTYLKFSLPTIPSNISQWIVNVGDRYVIAILLGTSFVGYYSLGYAVGNIILMMFAPFSFILPPILSQKYDNDNMDQVKNILKYSLKLFLFISVPAAFGISILSQQIITLLSTPQMAIQSYFITPFVAISMILWGIYGIIENILIIRKKTKIVGIIWSLAAILNIIINLLLIPVFGIIGAAIGTLITYIFSSLISVFYSFKFLKFEIELNFILKILFSSCVMSIFLFIFNSKDLISMFFSILISALIYFGLMLIMKGFTSNEVDFIKRILIRKG